MSGIETQATTGTPGVGEVARADERSQLRRALARLRRNRWAMAALGFLIVAALLGVIHPWIWPYDPIQTDFGNSFLGPSTDHWLGTDNLGRDIVARLLAGARISMQVSLEVVAIALSIAVPLGLVSGYLSGAVDNVLMRIMDAMLSIPPLVLALALAGALGPGLINVVIALSVVFTPTFVRLVRAQSLAVREETFVEASQSIGTPTFRVLVSRVLPNVASPLIVQASIALGGALLAEAALSFLGAGIQPPQASWGTMLRRAYDAIFTHPWQMVYPGAAIALAVLAFNTLGDGLRDALGIAAQDTGAKRGRHRGITFVEAGERPPASAPGDPDALLAVEDLSIAFDTPTGRVTVVDGVSFSVDRGEVLGLVGESGSGKTVTSQAIMRLISSPPGVVTSGRVWFEGEDLLGYDFDGMRRVRGNDIAMIFQDPMSTLNPAFTVGNQLVEGIRLHRRTSRHQARRRAHELLELVGIPSPRARLRQYPHEFSGGMRQRAAIAMALACDPKLLIADEPTTALDVTVQAQILELLRSLQQELEMSVIFVTHDLGVIADTADRVAVMYAGELVERADIHSVFEAPQHPYTAGLLAAIPGTESRGSELYVIPGRVPPPDQLPQGCRFNPRCEYRQEPRCTSEPIPLETLDGGRAVRCVRHDELELPGSQP